MERAFVHVDYDDDHNIHEEHKPLYEDVKKEPRKSIGDLIFFRKKDDET